MNFAIDQTFNSLPALSQFNALNQSSSLLGGANSITQRPALEVLNFPGNNLSNSSAATSQQMQIQGQLSMMQQMQQAMQSFMNSTKNFMEQIVNLFGKMQQLLFSQSAQSAAQNTGINNTNTAQINNNSTSNLPTGLTNGSTSGLQGSGSAGITGAPTTVQQSQDCSCPSTTSALSAESKQLLQDSFNVLEKVLVTFGMGKEALGSLISTGKNIFGSIKNFFFK